MVSRRNTWTNLLWAKIVIVPVLWGILCLTPGLNSAPDAIGYLFFPMLIWQCSMLGFWFGLGQSPKRWLLVPLLSPILGFVSSVAADGEWAEFQVFCLGIVLVVSFTTLMLRAWAGRLCRVQSGDGQEDALQFDIKQIFAWTTIAAILLAIARITFNWLWSTDQIINDLEMFTKILGLSAGISIAMVMNIWAMLGDRVSIRRIFTLVVVTVLVMVCNYRLFEDEFFVVTTAISQLMVLSTMFVIRKIPMRFVKSA